jgi:uncharacterized coiled-coil protein SlyX
MDMQTIINIGGTALLASFGYFFKENADKVSRLDARIHGFEMRIAQEYVRKDELTNHLTRIENMLGKIFDKLDNKVDK